MGLTIHPLICALLLSCVPKTVPPLEPTAQPADGPVVTQPVGSGKIGIQFSAQPEGLLVIGVAPGMGAEAAGLVSGDLITAVEGESLAGLSGGDARDRIMGPPGTSVAVTVAGPLGVASRATSIERRPLIDAPTPQRARKPPTVSRAPEIREVQGALRRKEVPEVEAALEAIIAADFVGESAGQILAGSLRIAARERPEVAALAVDRLEKLDIDDWQLYRALGETLLSLDEPARAAKHLERAESLRTPDYRGPDGVDGDLGGGGKGRRMLIDASVKAGDRGRAAEVARALGRTNNIRAQLALLSMAPLPEGDIWSAALPPVPGFEAELLTGEPWSLEAQRGQVVLITFWATWCGPCRKELPELETLWATRQNEGVQFLAVSLDDASKAAKVPEMIASMGVTFPVTHRPDLGADFGVGPIPAVRVLNRDGALHYAAKGYSAEAIERLDAQIQSALEDAGGGKTALGAAWGEEPSTLRHFLPSSGARGIWASGSRSVLGVEGASPMIFEGLPTSAEATVDGSARDAERRVAWLDGPVAANPGKLVLRAWDETGFSRWMVTTPTPIVDLASAGDHLYVATLDGLLVLDGKGNLMARHDGAFLDLASSADGVWAIDGMQRYFIPTDGAPQARGEAVEATRIDASGGMATEIADDLVCGRFGPDGALRTVVVREDGMIIGLNAAGAPGFTWKLSQRARLAVADLDGDGKDELLVSLRQQGLAVVDLSLK
ncbi:MAG: thiol-disulfide isomerase/thioredoxin [Myxococcota bacterium]|jgi:thiol-disulfide isomerase/thioredoxin